MTREAFTPSPSYPINDVGPFQVMHPYKSGSLTIAVVLDGDRVELADTEYTVSPEQSTSTGEVTLTTQAATDYEGGTLYIQRATEIEQGWVGQSAREKGLEGQLDWLGEAIQDLTFQMRKTLRTDTALPPMVPKAGHTIVMDDQGRFVPGPSTDAIADAGANAAAAAASEALAKTYKEQAEAAKTAALAAQEAAEEARDLVNDPFFLTRTIAQGATLPSIITRFSYMDGDYLCTVIEDTNVPDALACIRVLGRNFVPLNIATPRHWGVRSTASNATQRAQCFQDCQTYCSWVNVTKTKPTAAQDLAWRNDPANAAKYPNDLNADPAEYFNFKAGSPSSAEINERNGIQLVVPDGQYVIAPYIWNPSLGGVNIFGSGPESVEVKLSTAGLLLKVAHPDEMNDGIIHRAVIQGISWRGTDPTNPLSVGINIRIVKHYYVTRCEFDGFYDDLVISGANEPGFITECSFFSGAEVPTDTGTGGGRHLVVEAAPVNEGSANITYPGHNFCTTAMLFLEGIEFRNGKDAKAKSIVIRACDGFQMTNCHNIAFNDVFLEIDQQHPGLACTNIIVSVGFGDGQNTRSLCCLRIIDKGYTKSDANIKVAFYADKLNGVGATTAADWSTAALVESHSATVASLILVGFEADKCNGLAQIVLTKGGGVCSIRSGIMKCTAGQTGGVSGKRLENFLRIVSGSQATFFHQVDIDGLSLVPEDGLQASMPRHPIYIEGAVNSVTATNIKFQKGTGAVDANFDGLIYKNISAGNVIGTYWTNGNIDRDFKYVGSQSVVWSDQAAHTLTKGTMRWVVTDGVARFELNRIGNLNMVGVTDVVTTNQLSFDLPNWFTQNSRGPAYGTIHWEALETGSVPAGATGVLLRVVEGERKASILWADPQTLINNTPHTPFLISATKAGTDVASAVLETSLI